VPLSVTLCAHDDQLSSDKSNGVGKWRRGYAFGNLAARCRRVALMALRPSPDFAHCPNLTKEELTGVLSVFLRDLFTCSVECGINNRFVNYDIYISAQAKPSV